MFKVKRNEINEEGKREMLTSRAKLPFSPGGVTTRD
jgi:hypothetical protein